MRNGPSDNFMIGIAVVLFAGAAALVIFFGYAFASAIQSEPKERCEWHSKEKTGKTVYCGKACSRPQLSVTYTCDSGRTYTRLE